MNAEDAPDVLAMLDFREPHIQQTKGAEAYLSSLLAEARGVSSVSGEVSTA